MKPGLVALFALCGCSDYEVNAKPDEPVGEEPDDPEDPECEVPGVAFGVTSDDTCLVVAEPGTFTPVVEWQWAANPTYPGYDDIMSTPAAGNLTDDDGDGAIDDADVPDIVFTSFAGGAYTSAGTLTAISGDGSGTWWSVYDPGGYHIYSSGGVAIGDIDADGLPEVCTAGVEAAVVCLNADGSFKWAGGTEVSYIGCPAFADLDGDGLAEVLFGRQMIDATGVLRWTGTGGTGYSMSFAVDLDDDGQLEVIAGDTVYDADGSTRWTGATTEGMSAVGDFDLDGVPEVVNVYGGVVHLTSAEGVLLWQTSVPSGGGGPPTVADFDNDGYPEIGVAGAYYYSVYDTDGAVLWSAPVQDYSSSVTGSSVFDFEGDGAADVVYADEVTLWVYDGATGAVKLQESGHASGTLYEYPLILDVDHDGSTEIVLASNDYGFDGYNGITVIGDADDSWRPSRPVWNQFAYHVTNVDDDGGIPADQEHNWERWNSFRAGGSTLGLSTDLADVSPRDPDVCLVQCDAGTVEVLVAVENTGLADTPEFEVGLFHNQDLVAEQTLALRAGTGDYAGPFELTEADWRSGLVVRVDADAEVEECDETDNAVDLGAWPCP